MKKNILIFISSLIVISAYPVWDLIDGEPIYSGTKSAHFNGEIFLNREAGDKGPRSFLKMVMTESYSKWPESIDVVPKKIQGEPPSVTFIGHATFLIRVGGLNILTDPIYSERASPVGFAGPKRVRKPGVMFEDLPKIDIVLISHNHFDHLDIDTLSRLKKRDNPIILAGLGVDLYLQEQGLDRSFSLDWGEKFELSGTEFVFLECRHFSSRGVLDRNKTLWGSYGIFSAGKSIYFAGDTGYSSHFKEQGELYKEFDLALLPIGAYEPRWFMKNVHLNPDDAVRAHLDLNAKKSIGIHFGTFQLTAEPVDEPQKALARAKEKYKVPEQDFIAPEFGNTYSF